MIVVLTTTDLIKSIKKTINRKDYLITNLQIAKDIAENYRHNKAFNWIRCELFGYQEYDSIPYYRKIKFSVHEYSSSNLLRGKHEIMDYFSISIKEIIKNSKKDSSTYNHIDIKGTKIIESIQKSELLEIIEGVKRKLDDYISRLLKDPSDIEANLNLTFGENYREYQLKLKEEEIDISLGMFNIYFKNEKEKDIFTKNLVSLLKFEYERNYKFCMILMGTLIEFLLIRFCRRYKILPEFSQNQKDDTFAKYIESAIKNKLLEEKLRWVIIQSHLGGYKNYIDIFKEIQSPELDQNWYEIIKPTFEVLYDKFKSKEWRPLINYDSKNNET